MFVKKKKKKGITLYKASIKHKLMIKAVAQVDLSTAAHPCVSVGLIYLLIEFWGAAEQWGG